MGGSNTGRERQRENTRRAASASSVFLSALAGMGEDSRVVVRSDVHRRALDAARTVLRLYHSERRRQL